jgi:uncharacterized protein (DUF983 family)
MEERVDYSKEGLVFDIQRFSVNDGPGIRTIVFLDAPFVANGVQTQNHSRQSQWLCSMIWNVSTAVLA